MPSDTSILTLDWVNILSLPAPHGLWILWYGFFLFCSLQICKRNTLLRHLYQSTVLWEQHFPVPGHLWNSHCLGPICCTFISESYGPSTNRDVMCLLGLSILANMFVPQGERRQTLGERKRPFPILQGLQWSHLSEARSKDRSSLRAKYSFKPIWEFIRNFAAMFLGKELKVGEGKLRCIFIFITLH